MCVYMYVWLLVIMNSKRNLSVRTPVVSHSSPQIPTSSINTLTFCLPCYKSLFIVLFLHPFTITFQRGYLLFSFNMSHEWPFLFIFPQTFPLSLFSSMIYLFSLACNKWNCLGCQSYYIFFFNLWWNCHSLLWGNVGIT